MWQVWLRTNTTEAWMVSVGHRGGTEGRGASVDNHERGGTRTFQTWAG